MDSNDINYGIIIGWLKAMARINDKTNHGHEFSLRRFLKKQGLDKDIQEHFLHISENVNVESIAEPSLYLNALLIKWFYGFQKDNVFQSYYLEDKNNNFSLSDSEWKEEWCDEFVQLLMETTKANLVWKVLLGNTKGYYANAFDEIILESKEMYYHLHFSLTD